jgi:hypothetical protein
LLTRIKDDRVIFMVSDQKITIFLDRTDCDAYISIYYFLPLFRLPLYYKRMMRNILAKKTGGSADHPAKASVPQFFSH